jgi:hypothetical protein
MKWPYRKKAEETPPTEGEAEARKALHKADARVHQAQQGNPEVTIVVRTLKRYGERNNFTGMILKSLQKGGG